MITSKNACKMLLEHLLLALCLDFSALLSSSFRLFLFHELIVYGCIFGFWFRFFFILL